MDEIDDQDIKKAELSYCLKKSLDFVDQQAIDDVKNGKSVGDGTEGEEETPAEWRVDVRYAARLLKKANEMRARKRLCDLTIGLADGKLEAHKSLLAAGSPFFKHLTESTKATTLNFFHVPCSVADILFDFMYTGEISQDKVAKLSRTDRRLLREKAELFQIADQLERLWDQLGVDAIKPSARQNMHPRLAKNAAAPPEKEETIRTATATLTATATAMQAGDSVEIVKRKVLYMNEKRKQGDFADWKIRISAVDIPVSKVFLSASCTYFADFFARNPMDAKSETYTLTELNRRTFRKVLNFIYTGHVITEGRELGEIKDLLFQATYLGIGDLSSRLVEELESRLNSDNCFSMFSYANTINCRQLFKSISCYIGQLGSESAKSPGFLGLEFPDLRAALLNPELRFDRGPCLPYPTEFERCVFDLLLAWIRFDHVRRSSHVTELFEFVEKLGSPPYTGRKETMHGRMPKELNHVMSVYYSRLTQEPRTQQQQQQQQQQPQKLADPKQAVRVRKHMLPTRLLVSRDYPLGRPQLPGAALMLEKLQHEDIAPDRCWQLSPAEWKLQAVRIFTADEAFTRPTGLELTYQRYPLFSDDSAVAIPAIVRCGFCGAFEAKLELLATERIAQLGLGKESSSGTRVHLAWARTCIGRRLTVAGPSDGQDPCADVIASPDGSRGFLHGLELRFDGPEGAGGGVMSVVWAVEADTYGLGEAPWASVIEGE